MRTGPKPADSLDIKAVVGSPVAAFSAVYLVAVLAASATRVFTSIQHEAGHDVPLLLGSLVAALGSFGGFIIAEADLPVGQISFTLAAVPFVLTGLAAVILFHAHRRSESTRPHWESGDRLLAAASSGMVLLICCLAAWFVADSITSPDGPEMTTNLFLLAAGALAVGTISAAAGRESAHRANPAWLFTFRYVLATGLVPAIVLCTAATITREYGAASWLFVGNIAAAIWAGIHGGLVHWRFDLSPIGGPSESGTDLLVAMRGGPWPFLCLAIGAIAVIVASIAWRRHCAESGRWCLPVAFMCGSVIVLAAGVWASGHVRVGADATHLSAYALYSPINVPIMGAIGWAIDRLARLGYRSEDAVQPQR